MGSGVLFSPFVLEIYSKHFFIVNATMSPDIVIPDDIITMILLLLPVKSLVRFQSVSKSWLALITDPVFVEEHRSKMESMDENSMRFLFMYNRGQGEPVDIIMDGNHGSKEVVTLGLGDGAYALCDARQIKNAKALDFPLHQEDQPGRLFLAGSCNGLVCLVTPSWYEPIKIYLWNPSIKKIKALPNSNFISSCQDRAFYGFGFDFKNNDYKVVKTSIIVETDRIMSEVELYSSRLNSWKSIGNAFPSENYHVIHRPLVLNGSVHWSTKGNYKGQTWSITLPIVIFNMTKEVFEEIPVPKTVRGKKWYLSMLGKKYLCIMASLDEPHDEFEIWVMKEYGVVESWTKIYRANFGQGLHESLPVLAVMDNGEALLYKDSDLAMYDPRARNIEYCGVDELGYAPDVTTYDESLVWLEEPALNQGHAQISGLWRFLRSVLRDYHRFLSLWIGT